MTGKKKRKKLSDLAASSEDDCDTGSDFKLSEVEDVEEDEEEESPSDPGTFLQVMLCINCFGEGATNEIGWTFT